MTSDGNIYYLQYGVYVNQDVLNESIKKLDDYIVYEHDNKYYVYLGAYPDLMVALKMKKIFENQNIYTYIKNDYMNNSKLINEITIINKKILSSDKIDEILNYNKQIINLLKK